MRTQQIRVALDAQEILICPQYARYDRTESIGYFGKAFDATWTMM